MIKLTRKDAVILYIKTCHIYNRTMRGESDLYPEQLNFANRLLAKQYNFAHGIDSYSTRRAWGRHNWEAEMGTDRVVITNVK